MNVARRQLIALDCSICLSFPRLSQVLKNFVFCRSINCYISHNYEANMRFTVRIRGKGRVIFMNNHSNCFDLLFEQQKSEKKRKKMTMCYTANQEFFIWYAYDCRVISLFFCLSTKVLISLIFSNDFLLLCASKFFPESDNFQHQKNDHPNHFFCQK